MQLSFPVCPPQIKTSLASAVARPGVQAMVKLPQAPSAAGEAHEVYYLPAADLLNQQSLESARRVGWRMIHSSPNRSIAAEIDLTTKADNVDVTSINEGPFSAEPTRAVQALRQSQASGTYVVRMLRIPELYLMAIWLHAEQADRLIPIAPAPAPLKAGTEYSVKDLVAALAPAIQRRGQRSPDVDG